MIKSKEIIVTKQGWEKLQAELKELKEVRRPDVIGRIKAAKELGDLSENAEYSAAKDEQSFIEGRIQEIEQLNKTARVVENGHKNGKKTVNAGDTIKVEVEGEGMEIELVGPTEADPAKGKISLDSPVGQALAGRAVGEKVKVQTPDGEVVYKIVGLV